MVGGGAGVALRGGGAGVALVGGGAGVALRGDAAALGVAAQVGKRSPFALGMVLHAMFR